MHFDHCDKNMLKPFWNAFQGRTHNPVILLYTTKRADLKL